MSPVVCSTCNFPIEFYAGKWRHSWEIQQIKREAIRNALRPIRRERAS